eukprot:CAMPEP_0204012856 /NCGR_PEP_ID=MMETSP0360-20130528/24303_1 /ASSEMBLY_ACC=CAM_ASM_000342 /TAXON_ID=268821 /ORGANISM="Scrippsiella Hangoei, Strain SHTV-5" /LENGTH=74 /DNA_ID=CAMNT_0050955575 /DNA_START=72 /DNA_END=296 /DNA_ORIENTATION=+
MARACCRLSETTGAPTSSSPSLSAGAAATVVAAVRLALRGAVMAGGQSTILALPLGTAPTARKCRSKDHADQPA